MAAPNPNPAPHRRARAPTHEAKAFLNVLTPYVTKPTIDTRNVRVIDTVNNRAVPIATVHRAIGQLKRKAENNIRDRYKLPQGFVFTPDLKIAHKSTVSKEVVRANGPAIRAQVEAQRERMTPEEKAAILRQALDKQAEKREGKAFNKAVADIHKQIADAAARGPQDPNRLEFVGERTGVSYLHVPSTGEAFNPALAAHTVAALINKSEGAKHRETVKFIVKGCYSRTVNGQQVMNHKWLSLNNKDNALTIRAPYHESQIVSMLKELKPALFTGEHEDSEGDVSTTCHDIAIYAHYEPVEGGAVNDYKIIKTNGMKCRSFSSVNNNCMIACLLGATGTKVTRHDTLRKLYDIPLNTPIPAVSEAMGKLAQHFQVSLTIINERREELVVYESGPLEVTVCLLTDDNGLGHYALVESTDWVKKRCEHCNSRVFDLTKHECNANNISYFNDKINKSDTKFYTTRGASQKKRDNRPEPKIACFDFETFNEESQGCKACTYNAGVLIGDEYTSFWGPDSLKQFMAFVSSRPEPLIYISYNGAGFDSYFIMNYINENNIPLAKNRAPIIANGRLLTLELADGSKFFDLYNYTAPFSLDTLHRETFGLKEGAKSFFPHQFIHKWEDIEYQGAPLTDPKLYTDRLASMEPNDPELGKFKAFIDSLPAHYNLREESDKYLKIDCEVLQQCFLKIREQFKTDYDIDILESITLSSAAEKYFRSTIPKDKKIELGLSRELYDLYKRANYGGRVQPHRQTYRSADYGKPFEQIKDYLADVDAVSLYPSVMQANEYPVGEGRWLTPEQITEVQALLDSGNTEALKHGAYNVDVVPNPRLIIPAIPSKNEKGFTCWDVLPREDQCYVLPDIVSGIKHGYSFKLRRGYVFEDKVKIFSGYIDKVFTVKQEEDHHKELKSAKYNPVRRMISKLMMNCLYGKMSQKPIEDTSTIIKQPADFVKFLREHEWRDLHEMGDKVVAVGKKKDFSVCVRKPMQLGSYILAYSRSLMTSFMDKLDPERLNITDRASLEASWANTYMYGDTDSMLIHSSTLPRLDGILYDPKEHKCKALGMLDDELEGGKIIELFAPGPKLYAVKYVTPDGKEHEKIRGKGVVSYKLRFEDFPRLCNEEQVEKSFFMMQKYRWNIPQTLQSQGYSPFSIEGRIKTRTLGKTQWGGRLKLEHGLTLPHGFDMALLK